MSSHTLKTPRRSDLKPTAPQKAQGQGSNGLHRPDRRAADRGRLERATQAQRGIRARSQDGMPDATAWMVSEDTRVSKFKVAQFEDRGEHTDSR